MHDIATASSATKLRNHAVAQALRKHLLLALRAQLALPKRSSQLRHLLRGDLFGQRVLAREEARLDILAANDAQSRPSS